LARCSTTEVMSRVPLNITKKHSGFNRKAYELATHALQKP